ncbi:MAG: saccharopine dehydrogenase [Chlorobi bacterium]|nr:saccharopine dehydrogenase [Chlorobiota bacterium]
MKKVLILGAGMVVKPMVDYLLDRDFLVTLADQFKSKADAKINGHKNGTSISWKVDEEDRLDNLIEEHDLTVSLLPYEYHVMVAKKCIAHKKNMVTTSYVKPEMLVLNEAAKNAGVLILNEIGLDPGIDHMSAMRIIDYIHGKNGKVEEFYSFTGALVAPEVEKNPFNYKFTWAPKGVVMACNNDGKYLLKGKLIEVTTADLFKKPMVLDFPEIGKLEVYPNRDSLPYINLYHIPETNTIFRGTFRYKKWCEVLNAMKAINLLSNDKFNMEGMTLAGMVAKLIDADNANDIKQKTADMLKITLDSNPIVAMEWLGLFDDTPINRKIDSPFEVTADIMINKMMAGKEERDMIAMQHTFLASYPNGTKEVIKSYMLDFGVLNNDTSIARTVSLPAAIAVKMILENKIDATGVHIPVISQIYNPILDALEELNIKMYEEYGLPESENIPTVLT